MRKRFAGILTSLLMAIAIFTVSIIRGVMPNYAFSPQVLSDTVDTPSTINIAYDLIYPGKILPDHPLWYVKAIRDKIVHSLTFNHMSRAKLALKCADKRLQMAQEMFKKGKPDLGVATLERAEQYLAESVDHAKEAESSEESKEFLRTASLASLKHREIIEENILPLSPEDLKPMIVKTEDLSKISYTKTRDTLHSYGITSPTNPFELD